MTINEIRKVPLGEEPEQFKKLLREKFLKPAPRSQNPG